MAETISADYLVIGAGAMGMAFVDTMMTDTKATIALVDRYHTPGGHWTMAYPFVRLHQPSAYYGVNSKDLGQDKVDEVGWNKGLAELASGDEICAYYSQVMSEQFLPSGRVQYYPKCEYTGDGEFRSIITDKTYRVGQDTRIVNAAFLKVNVPSMGPPAYKVEQGVNLVTVNNLARITRPYSNYTVVGGGKTSMDACLWLLANGIEHSRITWIQPRPAWLLLRENFQLGPLHAEKARANFRAEGESIMKSNTLEELYEHLESTGRLLRFNKDITPTMFKCATVSQLEFEELKKIEAVVHKGKITEISPDLVTLENGSYAPTPDTLFVDCSAYGLGKPPMQEIFQGNVINLQPVRYCQQVFSAALIAHVDTTYEDEAMKNEMCRVVPHPNDPIDYLLNTQLTSGNTVLWLAQPKTAAWISQSRLDIGRVFMPELPEDADQRGIFMKTMKAQQQAVYDKLDKLLRAQPEWGGERSWMDRAQL